MSWKDIKRPENFPEAIAFFEFVRKNGEDPQWSIQYYGFGEHFTFWSGYGGFIDFDIDNGTAINWERMKEIIVESAQALYDDIKKNRPHLFEETGDKKLKKEKIKPKDCDLFLSERKLVNTFISWFDEWSDWALSDIWLINSVDFVEGVVSCWFSWDSPSYDFEMTVNFSDDEDCYLVVDMRQPLIVSFHSEIENRIAEKLIEKMRKVYTFYADNKDKVKQNKIDMLKQIFQFICKGDKK